MDIFTLFLYFMGLILLWLFIESAVCMGVRNGIIKAENIKNRHYNEIKKRNNETSK